MIWPARLKPLAAVAAAMILVAAGIAVKEYQKPGPLRAQSKAAPRPAARDEFGGEPRDQAREIKGALVQRKSETIKHDYSCTNYGQDFTEIRAPVDGYLAEVFIKEGQAVKKGDPLFKIRLPGDEDEKPDERKREPSAMVDAAITGGDLLFRLMSPEDEKKPTAENRNAVISIKAPYDGVVARLSRQPGHFVWKGHFLTTVVSIGTVWAYFEMPEDDYLDSATEWSRDRRQSQQLTLTLADGSKFPRADQAEGPLGGSTSDPNTCRFIAKFPNPDGLLRSGRSGTVTVSREWKDATFIPRRALIHDRDWRRYVYVVDTRHIARRRQIVIGDGTKENLVVTEGLGVGDRIVVDGVGQVQEGNVVE